MSEDRERLCELFDRGWKEGADALALNLGIPPRPPADGQIREIPFDGSTLPVLRELVGKLNAPASGVLLAQITIGPPTMMEFEEQAILESPASYKVNVKTGSGEIDKIFEALDAATGVMFSGVPLQIDPHIPYGAYVLVVKAVKP